MFYLIPIFQIYDVLSRLPFTSLRMSIIGDWEDEVGKVKRTPQEIDLDEQTHFNRKWTRVYPDAEYSLKVTFSRKQISNKVSKISKTILKVRLNE